MTDASAKSLGRKIAFYRSRRGLSQRDFGAMIERSETWVSQVERGVRRVDRMTVLRRVAEALHVPLGELAADTPLISAACSRSEPANELRMLLSSSLALALAVSPPDTEPDLGELRDRADEAWELAHAASYEALIPLLTQLLLELEAATRSGPVRSRRAASAISARAYHASAAALVKLGELPAAWVAADRAIVAAERAGDRLLMAEGAFRLTLVFQASRTHDQARRTAETAAAAVEPLAAEGKPAAISLWGAMHLQLAVIAARQNDAEQAYAELAEAKGAADRLGADRNDYNTEFGPTNVALHEVAVAIELGDAGRALRLAAALDTSGLSPERRGRLLIDVARAQMQRRNVEGTIRALLDAEHVTPEQTRRHWLLGSLLQDLDQLGHGADPRVRGLADRYQPAL